MKLYIGMSSSDIYSIKKSIISLNNIHPSLTQSVANVISKTDLDYSTNDVLIVNYTKPENILIVDKGIICPFLDYNDFAKYLDILNSGEIWINNIKQAKY